MQAAATGQQQGRAAQTQASTAERAEGRARVQALLWDRIDQAGMIRPRGETVEDHAAMRRRVCDRLAYMLPETLMILADIIVTNATGTGAGRARATVWPEAAIMTEAKAMQTPPAVEFPIVSSWLASIEGPVAVAGGFEVELYRHLAKSGRPPLPYDMHKIRERGEDAARQIALITGRMARGVADALDRQWLEAYQRDRRTVAAIVAAGRAKRAGAAS